MNVTANGIKHLTKLKNLRGLTLGYMSLGDETIKYLGQIVTLEKLELDGLEITDEGLSYLSTLRKIQWLYLVDCGAVTEQALRELEEKLPGKYEIKIYD